MKPVVEELLRDHWVWWRIAQRGWTNPLDPTFAQRQGGRWNPPASYPTLYLNEDRVTARMNLRAFIAEWPYGPGDLRSESGPVLVGALLPRRQRVCDAHSPQGIAALGLPRSYPLDCEGRRVPHACCQALGQRIRSDGLRGVRVRSAQGPDGIGREVAWFPATARSVARRVKVLAFDDWYWA